MTLKLTPAKDKALSLALTDGHVYQASRNHYERNQASRIVIERLVEAGYLEWVPLRQGMWHWPHAKLTEAGITYALTLPDRESSASRQHQVDTGKWLKYGDRPEWQPKPDFPVGSKVQRIGRPGEDVFRILAAKYHPELGDHGWLYDAVRVLDEGNEGEVFKGCVIGKAVYEPLVEKRQLRVTFTRIGRTDSGVNLTLLVPKPVMTEPVSNHWLAVQILKHVKHFILSSDAAITINSEQTEGKIEWGRYGEFTITEEDA